MVRSAMLKCAIPPSGANSSASLPSLSPLPFVLEFESDDGSDPLLPSLPFSLSPVADVESSFPLVSEDVGFGSGFELVVDAEFLLLVL